MSGLAEENLKVGIGGVSFFIDQRSRSVLSLNNKEQHLRSVSKDASLKVL